MKNTRDLISTQAIKSSEITHRSTVSIVFCNIKYHYTFFNDITYVFPKDILRNNYKVDGIEFK